MKLLKALINLIKQILIAVILLPFWFIGYIYIYIRFSKTMNSFMWAIDMGKKSAVQRKLKTLEKKGKSNEQDRS